MKIKKIERKRIYGSNGIVVLKNGKMWKDEFPDLVEFSLKVEGLSGELIPLFDKYDVSDLEGFISGEFDSFLAEFIMHMVYNKEKMNLCDSYAIPDRWSG